MAVLQTKHATLILLLLVACVLGLASAGTNEAGLAFLEENRGKPGVVELPSGLQYKVLRRGRGTAHPTSGSPCSCHYEGTLIDGTVFDSSYERGEPASFAPNQVIKGWTEAMQMMVAGDKWEMYIPSELAYGDRGSPPNIGPGETLIFRMEILAIQGSSTPALQCKIASPDDDCNEREKTYIGKVSGYDASKASKEIRRLRSILGGPMKDDLRDWARRRVNILEQVVEGQEAEL